MDQETVFNPLQNGASLNGNLEPVNSGVNPSTIPPEDEWKKTETTSEKMNPPASVNSTPPPDITPPPQPPPHESFFSNFSKGSILKIILGLLGIFLILFLIFGVILPNFGKKKVQNITLTYWGLWEDSRVMGGIISDFERQNPNITIDYKKEEIKDYRDRLTTRINNGNGPDMFRFHNSWYPMLSNVLLPLPESVINKDQFKTNYYPVANNDLVKNGAIYGIPLEIDTLSLFVNNDLFQASGINPPKTWEEYRDDAKILTVKDENGKIKTSGAAIGTYANIAHAPDILSLLILQNGGDLNNLTNTQKQTTDALRFYTSFSGFSGSVWDDTLDPSILNFAKGNVGMIFGYSWDYLAIKSINPQLNFQVVPVPQLSSSGSINMASYWAEGISAKSKHQKEALLFMKYLTDPTVSEKLYSEESKVRNFGELYSNMKLANLVKDNNLSTFLIQAKTAVSSFIVDGTYDNGLNEKSNKYIENAINSVNNSGSPDTATSTLIQGIDQVRSQYGL